MIMAPLPLKSLLFPIILFLPLVYLVISHLWRRISSAKIPPGPYPWPIVGNILQMGKMPHVALTNLALAHGPVISMRLGTQLVTIASSVAAATEVMKTYDRVYSARHVPGIVKVKYPQRNDVSVVWATECTDRWKFLRTLLRTELFSVKAIDGQAGLREKKVMEMVKFVCSKEVEGVKVAEVVFATMFNILSNLLFSKDVMDLGDGGGVEGTKGAIRKMVELGNSPNLADFYPVLDAVDLQGIKKKGAECFDKVSAIWEPIVKQRREEGNFASQQRDFLDVMLNNKFDDEQINSLVMELFTAGSDTSTSTIEWAMAELIRSPKTMAKVLEELKRNLSGNVVKESDASNLSYLQACIKETFRLHPPAPFLIPRRASESCKLMDYTVPKNAKVLVNVWAIGRDPTAWKDPLVFRPERFLDSSVDYKGNDFELTPFGAGRRICPGLPMASRHVPLILATLIHQFEWELPNKMDPSQLDMSEKFGVTLQMEQPLHLIPKLKRQSLSSF